MIDVFQFAVHLAALEGARHQRGGLRVKPLQGDAARTGGAQPRQELPQQEEHLCRGAQGHHRRGGPRAVFLGFRQGS